MDDQPNKQNSGDKLISDFIHLYLLVYSGIDSIKSNTNSKFTNLHCGILLLAPVNKCQQQYKQDSDHKSILDVTDLHCKYVIASILSSLTLILNSQMWIIN